MSEEMTVTLAALVFIGVCAGLGWLAKVIRDDNERNRPN